MLTPLIEGNQCSDILSKASKLESKLPEKLKCYTTCLKAFNIVKSRAFGMVADPNYLAAIQDFKNCYKAVRNLTQEKSLQLSVTPSVHVVLVHVHQFYQRHGTARGLGWYSEQATESSHSDFLSSVWVQGYQVPDTHLKYPVNLKGANAQYNASHN